MSMSTHVVGFRAPDERWKQMKAVWDACKFAGINPPPEVLLFFNHEYPGDKPGMEIPLGSAAYKLKKEKNQDGYEVNLDYLHPDIRFIRFYNSW